MPAHRLDQREAAGSEEGHALCGRLEARAGVLDQDESRVREAHAAPDALEQLDSGLTLQHRELL